jgi:glycosyltransferase involved in cell wall biosynthesis
MTKVSVVMSCYNEETTVSKAIDSILNQSFEDFEFIVIDDGSYDRTQDIIKGFTDTRIKFFANERNIGLAGSLNKGIRKAKGKYIARMDADDWSVPDRIEKQVEFLESNSKFDVLGSNALFISDDGQTKSRLPLGNESITKNMYRKTTIIHPSVMVRKAAFNKYGLYNENLSWAEDKDLWLRWRGKVKFSNLGETLIHYQVKEKLNAKILYYNHYVLLKNMIKRRELLSNWYFFLRSVVSQTTKWIIG